MRLKTINNRQPYDNTSTPRRVDDMFCGRKLLQHKCYIKRMQQTDFIHFQSARTRLESDAHTQRRASIWEH